MNDWMEGFLSRCLADVPPGKYRTRAEKELRDHMETLRQSMPEAEVLRAMGDPEQLRAEYEAAWAQTLPEQLAACGHCVAAWVVGFAVMLGAHFLGCYVRNQMSMAPTPENPNGCLFALTAGAFYLSRKFQASRRPAWRISVGLSFYWAFYAALCAWWSALDNHHRPFWEAIGRHFYYNARYYALTLAFCVLLGMVFGWLAGQKNERSRELA